MKDFFLCKNKFSKVKDRVFLKDLDGNNLTFQEFNSQVDYQINFFKKKKLRERDLLLLICSNSIKCSIIIFAAAKYGLSLITIPNNSTSFEINKIIEESKPKRIISLEKNLIRNKKINKEILFIKNTFSKNIKIKKVFKTSDKGYLIVKSSGTTGKGKNICLSFKNLWKAGENFCKIHNISSNEIFWNYLPFSYLGGLFNLLILPATAASSVLVDKSFNSTMLLSFISVIKNFKISHIWLVPSILKSLLILHKHTKIDLKKIGLKKIFVGTAPLEFDLKLKFERKFGVFPLENYGLSETTFLSSEISGDKKTIKKGFVGKKLSNIKLKIFKEKNKKYGEIFVKTPYLFEGYFVNGFLKKIKKNNYFPTGDIGNLNNNLVKIISRKKNIIKKGGIMILPEELEKNIKNFNNSFEPVCLGKKSYLYGEDFDLFLKISSKKNSTKYNLNKFKNWYFKNFRKLHWPDNFYLINDFPTTSSGKIEKFKLNNKKYKTYEF